MEVGFTVEFGAEAAHHFNVFAEFFDFLGGEKFVEFWVVEAVALDAILEFVAFAAVEEDELVVDEVVAAFEIATHADGPAGGGDVEGEFLFDFVKEVERVEAFAVEFVDEGDDWHVAQAADFEEFVGLGFDAFCGVENHDGAVDGGENAVGVFGEIFVAGGVEEVVGDAVIFEGHDGGCDGDAAFLLDFHPVGGGAAAFAFGFDCAGELDGAAEEEEFFRDCRFPRIWVGDNREGASVFDDVG